MSATSLDLHGRNFEDAISQVTLFLERIRRTVASSSRGRGRQNILFVTIITGSGSVRIILFIVLNYYTVFYMHTLPSCVLNSVFLV